MGWGRGGGEELDFLSAENGTRRYLAFADLSFLENTGISSYTSSHHAHHNWSLFTDVYRCKRHYMYLFQFFSHLFSLLFQMLPLCSDVFFTSFSEHIYFHSMSACLTHRSVGVQSATKLYESMFFLEEVKVNLLIITVHVHFFVKK